MGLVAVAASAAGSVNGLRHGVRPTEMLPAASGDLGEVVVTAPHDLGEIVVRIPHDLEDVLVDVRPLPPSGQYLAKVIVTASRIDSIANADGAPVALASVR